jgi:hypothetical protein
LNSSEKKTDGPDSGNAVGAGSNGPRGTSIPHNRRLPRTRIMGKYKVTYTEGRQQPFAIWKDGRISSFAATIEEVERFIKGGI